MKKLFVFSIVVLSLTACGDKYKKEMVEDCSVTTNNRDYCKCSADAIERALGKKAKAVFELYHQSKSGEEIKDKVSISDPDIYDRIDRLDKECLSKYPMPSTESGSLETANVQK